MNSQNNPTIFDLFSDATNSFAINIGPLTYVARLEGEEIVLRPEGDRFSESRDLQFRINARTLQVTPSIIANGPSKFLQAKDIFGLPGVKNTIRISIKSQINAEGIEEVICLQYLFDKTTNSFKFHSWVQTLFVKNYQNNTYVVLFTLHDNKIIVASYIDNLQTIQTILLETTGSYEDAEIFIKKIDRVVNYSAVS